MGQNVLDPEYDLTHYREKLGIGFTKALISYVKFKRLRKIRSLQQTTVLKRDRETAEKVDQKKTLEKVGMGSQ